MILIKLEHKIATRISEFFGASKDQLEELGIYDTFIDIDAKLYLDPSLLSGLKIPEFEKSNEKFNNYFEEVITLLSASTRTNDIFFNKAYKKLMFHELKSLHLGYSVKGKPGRGIGKVLAQEIAETAFEIIKAGIKDPAIFKLVGIFQEGIGADFISDMTACIIKDDIIEYTQRVAKSLFIKTIAYHHNEKIYELPYSERMNKIRLELFVPKGLLRDLPFALDYSEIDAVCMHNEALRERVNKIVGNILDSEYKHMLKSQIKNLILRDINILKLLIEDYNNAKKLPYDFDVDPLDKFSWYDIGLTFAKKYPLVIQKQSVETMSDLKDIALKICKQFKKLLEDNGLNIELYKPNGKFKHESSAQRLFYAIADTYCKANNLDVSREPNGGPGPVDFKISKGNLKVLVEIKYSKNDLIKALEKQIPTYEDAEGTTESVLVVLQTDAEGSSIEKLQRRHTERLYSDRKPPELVIAKVYKQPTASKR